LPEQRAEALVGKEISDLLGLKIGDVFNVDYASGEEGSTDPLNIGVDMTVSGILETGGSEEDYVYMSMGDLQSVVGGDERLDIVELSISAAQSKLSAYEDAVASNVEGVTPRLVKRVTQSESAVLTKLQALVFLVTAVVLVLTMICVATTMTAVVTERRKEIGLRKALGASDGGIIGEFMAEGILLGGLGGLIGSLLGFVFAQFVSVNVFSSSITFQPVLLPITIVVSILVTGLACMLPVRSAIYINPAIVLKGE
jgi:putative ABC transport system permease protein